MFSAAVRDVPRSVKEYTARQADKLLKQRGQFWAADYWDTFMRDLDHELQAELCGTESGESLPGKHGKRLALAPDRGTSRPAAR
jgi:hypothetical protein